MHLIQDEKSNIPVHCMQSTQIRIQIMNKKIKSAVIHATREINIKISPFHALKDGTISILSCIFKLFLDKFIYNQDIRN